MRKTIERDNFGDENEVPLGLGYIKDNEKEGDTKKSKRQSLKVDNDSAVKSDEVKSDGVKSDGVQSNKVKTEKVKSEKSRTRSNKVKFEENEIDGPSSSEEKKPNSYKRQETKKKNRKMSSVDFSDSDTEVENQETVI